MTDFSRLAMRCYSVQWRDQIFAKGYEFLSFARNMYKSIGKNTVKNFLIILNNLPQQHLKLLQKEPIKEKAEGTCDLIGNKIANRITKNSKTSPKNNSEANEEISSSFREWYTSSERRY